MNSSHWRAVLGVILVYLFGCFSGGISTSIFFQRKIQFIFQHPAIVQSAAMEKRFTKNLGLDASQKEQIHGYFAENLRQRKEVQKQIQPQIQALNLQMLQQIAAILHPDQVERFDKNVEPFRKRMEQGALKLKAENQPAPVGQPASPATNAGTSNPPAQ